MLAVPVGHTKIKVGLGQAKLTVQQMKKRVTEYNLTSKEIFSATNAYLSKVR